MKKIIATIVIVALLIALAPAVVYAAPGEVTGQGKGGNTPPTVDNVTLVELGSETEVTAMTPLTTYRVKATCGDINTIDDIETIEFHVYHTSDPDNWDADACAIFLWDKDAGWTMEYTAETSWEIVSANCTAPSVGDMTETTGDWYLGFKPGELAWYDGSPNWHASVEATDDQNASDYNDGLTTTGASMGAFAGIGFDDTTIVFGDAANGIPPGESGYITAPADHYLTAKVRSNKVYALGVQSQATWSDNTTRTITLNTTTSLPSPTLGSGEFALGIDDVGDTPSNPYNPDIPQTVTNVNADITGYGTVARVTTEPNVDEVPDPSTFYMELWFALAGIDEVTYSGAITFTVTN